MPSALCGVFKSNRRLLTKLGKIGADIIKEIAQTKDVLPRMFLALHTFGRELNWNPHLHISKTQGGLNIKGGLAFVFLYDDVRFL